MRRPVSRPSLSIHSEHLDVQLVKYLYQVYFNQKVLRHALAPDMKRQSDQAHSRRDGGESTPKRAPSLLRVTYFDDFDLFRTAASEGAATPGKESKVSAAAAASVKINNDYNKSTSANDLDAKIVYPRIHTAGVAGPNKSQSLDKSFQGQSRSRDSERSGESSLSETAPVPATSQSSRTCLGSPATPHVSTTSSSITESFRDAADEEEFETPPPPRSRDSSTASSGLVSCASRVHEETLVPDAEPFSCDTSGVRTGGRAAGGSDVSCSSIASSSTTTTLRSSQDLTLSEQRPGPAAEGLGHTQ